MDIRRKQLGEAVDGRLPLGGREIRGLEGYYKQDAAVDYWTGENTE